MHSHRILELIEKFNAQTLTADEQQELETFIESGEIELNELGQLADLEDQVQKIVFPAPSPTLDNRFRKMLASQKRIRAGFSWHSLFSWREFVPKLALASLAFVAGISLGYFALTKPNDGRQIEALSKEVADLKEMMMLSLLQKESAIERLKAVSLTEEMGEASAKVTGALIQTLNGDENVNVRLAALEALKPYVADSHVRQALIQSIAQQDSPLVQVALAELMAALQEKSSVQELRKIIQSEKTPNEIKMKIRESIKILS